MINYIQKNENWPQKSMKMILKTANVIINIWLECRLVHSFLQNDHFCICISLVLGLNKNNELHSMMPPYFCEEYSRFLST
jgi:hypothetical protein